MVRSSTGPARRRPRADVAIEDGRIVDVGPGLDGDERVDVAGKTLLPGLFDCHVHLAALRGLRRDPRDARAVLAAVLPDGGEPADHAGARHHDRARRVGRRRRPQDGRRTRACSPGRGCRSASTMLVDDRRPQRPVAARAARSAAGASSTPACPSGVCDGVDGVIREGARDDPRRRRRDQDRVLGRLPLPRRRSEEPELLAGRGRRDRADRRRPRDAG